LKLADLELRAVEISSGGRTIVEADVVRSGLQLRLALWDTLLVSGDGASYTLDLRNRSGKQVARIHVEQARRRLTKQMRDAMIEAELARLGPGGPGCRPVSETRQIVASAPYADELPAFRGFFTTPDGLLWVLDGGTLTEEGWAATAFRRDGAIVARLRGSGVPKPVAFSTNRVLLRAVDQDGVVSFRLHRISVSR
jgi:hypothetical protein